MALVAEAEYAKLKLVNNMSTQNKNKISTKKVLILAGLGVLLAIIILWAIFGCKSLDGLDKNTENEFNSVQVQFSKSHGHYQRREALVSGLIMNVESEPSFKPDVLLQLKGAKNKATSIQIDPSKATPEQIQQYQNAQGELSQALGKLLAITENYPQLTATQNFKDLQVQLEGTENRIQVARSDYNEAVGVYNSGAIKKYNSEIKEFPASILASLFGYPEKPLLELDKGTPAL
jgi:LemA protein